MRVEPEQLGERVDVVHASIGGYIDYETGQFQLTTFDLLPDPSMWDAAPRSYRAVYCGIPWTMLSPRRLNRGGGLTNMAGIRPGWRPR